MDLKDSTSEEEDEEVNMEAIQSPFGGKQNYNMEESSMSQAMDTVSTYDEQAHFSSEQNAKKNLNGENSAQPHGGIATSSGKSATNAFPLKEDVSNRAAKDPPQELEAETLMAKNTDMCWPN